MGPDFICIGAQKGGTGWVSQCLSRHEMLWNPGHKELHFFDNINPNNNNGELTARARPRFYSKKKLNIDKALRKQIKSSKEITFNQYLALFDYAPKSCKTYEITPAYGSMGSDKLQLMNRLLPNTKYLYIVRDPIDRAMSSLRMWIERAHRVGKPPQSYIERWINEQLELGRYSKHLPSIEKILNKNSKVIYKPFGQIKTEPLQCLRDLEKFIGIPESDYDYCYSNQYHKTDKTVHVPSEVSTFIKEQLESERDFLRNFFDEKFASQCS